MREIRLSRLLVAGLAVLVSAALAACGGSGSSSDSTGSTAAGGSEGSSEASSTKVTAIDDETGPTAETQVPFVAGLKSSFEAYDEELEEGQHPIDVEYLDDKYDPSLGLSAYKKATTNGSVAVIGPNASATQPAIAKTGMTVPLISSLTTTILDEEYLWNLLPTFTDQASIMVNAEAKKQKGDLRVAGLFYDVPSGVEFGEALKEATEEVGGEYLGDVTISPEEAAGDWRAQAQALAELNPSFVGVLGSAGDPQTFLPAMANAGLTDATVAGVTPLGLYKDNWTSVPKSLAEKFFVTSSISPADFGTEGAAEVEAAAKAAGKPEYANNIYFVQGYVTAQMTQEAINQAGDEPTAESVNEAIASITDFETGGLNPPLCFSQSDHYGTGAARPIRVDLKTEKFEPVGEFAEYEKFISTPDGGACK